MSMMIGEMPVFSSVTGDWLVYTERLEQFFEINEIPAEKEESPATDVDRWRYLQNAARHMPSGIAEKQNLWRTHRYAEQTILHQNLCVPWTNEILQCQAICSGIDIAVVCTAEKIVGRLSIWWSFWDGAVGPVYLRTTVIGNIGSTVRRGEEINVTTGHRNCHQSREFGKGRWIDLSLWWRVIYVC